MSLSRRQALAGLAATAAMPLLSGCARLLRHRAGAAASAGRADQRGRGQCAARLDRQESPRAVARERHLARHRHGRPGMRCARRLSDRSAAGQAAPRGDCSAPTWRGPRRSTPAALTLRDPHQRRGRAQRLSHRARGLRPALWRRRGRRLAQHALCRDPECRRLSRRAALPRHRSPDRECGRCRGLSGAARQLSRATRRRARADAGCRGQGADPAGLPDRQGDPAARRSASRTRAKAAGWSNRSNGAPRRSPATGRRARGRSPTDRSPRRSSARSPN